MRARPVATPFGPFRLLRTALPGSGRAALALVRGEPRGRAPLLARVHSSCVTSEALGALDCDCADQLRAALAAIAAEGRGVLLYLLQEGRGAGLAAKARDRMWVQASEDRLTTFEAYERMGLPHDLRRYDAVPALLARLGVEAPIRLLTHNPEKAAALARAGVRLAGTRALPHRASPWSWHYLAAKTRSGHALAPTPRPPPAPPRPERVEARAAQALAGAPHLVHVATWWIPVRLAPAEAPRWVRTHLVVDARHGDEHLVLEVGRPDADAPRRVLRDRLEDRLPAPGGAPGARRVAAALGAFARAGRGRAVVLGPDAPPTRRAPRALLDAALPPPVPCTPRPGAGSVPA